MESTDDAPESTEKIENTTSTLVTTVEESSDNLIESKDTITTDELIESGADIVKDDTIEVNKEVIDTADDAKVTKKHDDDEDDKEVDIDMFVDKNLIIFGNPEESVVPIDHIVSYIDSNESVSEEEEDVSFEIYDYFGDLAQKEQQVDKKEPINRENLINELQTLQDEKYMLRRKNNLLHRRVAEYYRKRKLDQVFQDSYSDITDNLYERYDKKIDEMSQERTNWQRDKTLMDNEIYNMQITKSLHLEYLEKILNNLLNREKEVGALLVDPNTGKKVPEKIYGRLIQRQRHKSAEIAEIRLVFIKHRDKVREIENKLKTLETIDGTLHLMDFEQLRMENTTYTDKIEERDEELMRLRERHSHANSVLAHTREKSNVIVVEIEEKKEESLRQGYNVSEIREYLNELKIKRDSNRALAEKLNLNSGLLTFPRLLLDMEQSLKIEQELNNQLEELKKTNREERAKLIAIRSSMEQTEHTIIRSNSNRNKQIEKDESFYYGRPTISKPNLSRLLNNSKHDLF